MKLSVIVPTFENGHFLASALKSTLAQTLRPTQIIVVDDGSTDDTSEVVAGFGEAITYIRQTNAGVAAARNRGVSESSGELIAFLDGDDIWELEKLERQVAKFSEDLDIGLVHCGMREFDSDSGETIALHLDGGEGWVAEDLALCEKPVIIGPGGSIVVRRDVFEAVGGFDPALKNGEDWEFCFRVAMKYKVGFVREVLVNYRNHGANASKNVFEMERSSLKAWAKVFHTDDLRIRKLKRRSYGNLHKVLAGSFLHKGEMRGFVRNLIKSLWYRPSYASFYLQSLIVKKD